MRGRNYSLRIVHLWRKSRSIFINYRRDDAGGEAGWLCEALTRNFRRRNVFIDVNSMTMGEHFPDGIHNKLKEGGVLLAVIGPQWGSMTDKNGFRRLDDPEDYVRMEIAAALSNKETIVIPVFVRGASMPPPKALPEPLKDLAYRNGFSLSHAHWQSDVALLVRNLKKLDPVKKKNILAATLALLLLAYVAFVRLMPPPPPPIQHNDPVVPSVPPAAKPNAGEPLADPKTSSDAPQPPTQLAAMPVSTPYQVSFPYNMHAIYTDGAKFDKKASMDGVGDACAPLSLTGPGASTVMVRGIPFRIGPVNELDAIHSSNSRAVSIDLDPGPYNTLAILGVAIHHSQLSQEFSINYGETSPSTHAVSQSFSDWAAVGQPHFPREEEAIRDSYRNTSNGTRQPGSFALYLYRIPLDSSQPLASLSLPKNDAVIVLAITLLP